MEQYENMLEQFADKHPVWFWVLVRLLICLCWSVVAIAGCLATVALIGPVVMVCMGYGSGYLWLFLSVPVLITICWAVGTLAIWLYQEFVY